MSAAVAALGASLKKGRIKIILIAVVVLLLLGGGVAYVATKSAHAEDDDEVEVHDAHPAKAVQPGTFDPKTAPTFMPMDVFTVNLADRDTDRFAQVGVTLEVEDAKVLEQVKAYMPAIRNNILMLLSSKTAEAVRDEAGKRRLAAEIRAQALRPLGYDVAAEDLMDEGQAPAASNAARPRKQRKSAPTALPIKSVHFSNFIVQ
ncbi:flagellar basal body-associated FliL family protein [Azohydromonas lata]|jgi:flagellar FliL protein|uniref:flagellar basal body-associated FliL family protein n=1 Tax=Azohydromonas lata TaxID=45677 RepID=UPI0008340544|nr:flagellar basal body-associated FliL family protein [Azohydromonas lata]